MSASWQNSAWNPISLANFDSKVSTCQKFVSPCPFRRTWLRMPFGWALAIEEPAAGLLVNDPSFEEGPLSEFLFEALVVVPDVSEAAA